MIAIVVSGAEVRAGAIVLAACLGFRLLLWWVRRRSRKDFE